MLDILERPQALDDVYYRVIDPHYHQNYIMQGNCSSKRICEDLLLNLGILRLRQPRNIYPPHSALLTDIKRIYQRLKALIDQENVCHLCARIAREDERYMESTSILSGAIENCKIKIGISNSALTRFDGQCLLAVKGVNENQGCINQPVVV